MYIYKLNNERGTLMKNYVIAIAREYASGAGEIAKKLSLELGIKVYDKEMISLAAKESGLAEAVVAETEQKRTNSFLYSVYMTSQVLPLSDQIFMTQSQIVKNLAKEESCIIIGRCAGHILADNPSCLKIFIHADMDDRIKRAKTQYGLASDKPAEHLKKIDKQRAAYYKYFTEKAWNDVTNYDISINSSKIGIDEAVKIIKEAALKMYL